MKKSVRKRLLIALVAVAIFVVGGALLYNYFNEPFDNADEAWIFIPRNSSADATADSIRAALGDKYGNKIIHLLGDKIAGVSGAYKIVGGDKAKDIRNRLLHQRQTPVRLTYNNIRTISQLSDRICSRLDVDPAQLQEALQADMKSRGVAQANYPAYFFPDTYEFYWNADPATIVSKLTAQFDRFWTEERRSKAASMGLTPEQVATLASIVEEETNVRDERPMVARLYLNRLNRGMKLQADPTVKFAVGDFSLRRILAKHLAVQSPYNTYLNNGLPIGPIRIPERATLDAVLNAPAHPYLYMCAKEDFSGRHNFAADYATHQANARRYHQALDKRGL